MENDYLSFQLGAMAKAVSEIDRSAAEIKNSICVLLGCLKADRDFASPTYGNGDGNLTEEIKLMIIDLNVKGSVRRRKSGLIELRTQAFGSIYGHSKIEIEQKLNRKLKETKKKKALPEKKSVVPMLSEFYTQVYLPYKQQTVTPNSLRGIRRSYTAFLQNGFDIPLDEITTLQIEKFLFEVDKTRTRQVLRGTMNNLLEYAKQLGVIKDNPCDNVSKIKHEKNVGRALSFRDQMSFFYTLFASDKISTLKKLYYAFVYLTGTRRSEALSVRFSDVDPINNVLHIPGTKTKTSDRDFPLFPLVRKIVECIPPTRDVIFELDKSNATHDMKRAAPDYHLHELRHTFGTIAICVQKLDPKTVAMYMGHSDPYTTLNTYTHPEQLDKALFFDGSKSDAEKLKILQNKYVEVLAIIDEFVGGVPKTYPNND